MRNQTEIESILALQCENSAGFIHDGVKMQFAGANSSCSFYLGTSNGKLFKLSIDYTWDQEEEEMDKSEVFKEILPPYRVGYLGNRNSRCRLIP